MEEKISGHISRKINNNLERLPDHMKTEGRRSETANNQERASIPKEHFKENHTLIKINTRVIDLITTNKGQTTIGTKTAMTEANIIITIIIKKNNKQRQKKKKKKKKKNKKKQK